MTEIIAQPERTWAVVVGVEQYDAGPKWSLNGPVSDATRFVRWLRKRHVPAEQILLLLAPLDGNRQLVNELKADPEINVSWDQATQNKIEESLYQIHQQSGDLLYLFLGGHGAVHEDERLLYCSDAREDYLRNLNLDNLLHSLRTDFFRGFRDQVIFVDTCAEYVDRASNIPFTPPKNIPAKGNQLSTNQFLLYAAADGQLAGNDSVERTGHFSRVVLEWLEGYGLEANVPDFDQLATSVKDYFVQLLKRGETVQTPICIRHRSRTGEEDDLFGTMAGIGERLGLMREVREQLNVVKITTKEWQELYRQTVRYINRPHPDSLMRDQIIRYLSGFETNSQNPLLELIWRAGRAWNLEEVQSWAKNKIGNQTRVADLEARFEAESAHPLYYLLIELAVSGSTQRPFAKQFRWWLWDGVQGRSIEDGECKSKGTRVDIQAKIIDLIENLRSKHNQAQLQIEIFVIREQLSLDLDCWDYRGSALGANYPIAVRPADRSDPENGDCQLFVKKIRKDVGRCARPGLQWLPDKGLPRHKISPLFTHPTDCREIFGFSAPVSSGEEIPELFATLLNCGVPFVLWPRNTVAEGAYRQKLRRVAAAGSLDDFPSRLRDFRCNNHHTPLTLFWDDPARRPVRRGFDPGE
jgi:hypothetical protein